MRRRLVPFLNWVNLSTPVGLVVARLSGCRVSAGPHGLLLAEGYRRKLPKARAFTLGSVVLLRGSVPHQASAGFARMLEHEARHTHQYAACLGLPFLPAYALAAGYSLARTGDPASRNAFERGAGLADGGYTERPLRPLSAALPVLRGRKTTVSARRRR
ncbi:DUF4157 domain-containing protein [Arthrobacter echini]|uniref:DUF4157 domain-containing protein n=1 Tax=Arthrobacter echini TaxID=1529066 RepID=A0A4S5E0T8_9MICC|nr:DUF4157 domain-containing protein [Arthrobacter echini]THJ64917.1 DUF4157 domain-containing protein [Arthrobacter echini]